MVRRGKAICLRSICLVKTGGKPSQEQSSDQYETGIADIFFAIELLSRLLVMF